MKELEKKIGEILYQHHCFSAPEGSTEKIMYHQIITDLADLICKRETYPVCSACHKPIVRWHLRCNCDCAGDENEERTDD